MSTTNIFALRKLEEKDIVFGDLVETLKKLDNDNMDAIDAYLAQVNVTSISSNYSVQPTDQLVYAAGGTPVVTMPPAASVSLGRAFMIANNTGATITVQAADLTINAVATIGVGPSYQMKHIVRAADKYVAY